MSDELHNSGVSIFVGAPRAFNTGPSPEELLRSQDDLRADLIGLGLSHAEHAGQLKGASALIASLQSTFGAWTAAALGVGGLMLAALTLLGTFAVLDAQKLDAHSAALAELQRGQQTLQTANDQTSTLLRQMDQKLSTLVEQLARKKPNG
jgi:hypothetical protein